MHALAHALLLVAQPAVRADRVLRRRVLRLDDRRLTCSTVHFKVGDEPGLGDGCGGDGVDGQFDVGDEVPDLCVCVCVCVAVVPSKWEKGEGGAADGEENGYEHMEEKNSEKTFE